MIPELQKLNPTVVKSARGKGLMNAIEIHATDGGFLKKLICCCVFDSAIVFKVYLGPWLAWVTV